MSRQRPDPEQFLQQAKDEELKQKRGNLKIYLGAAPGVGKTYAMLEDALEERAKGLDIIVGVVESHGRKEIESLISHFDILPRKVVDYHDKQFYEFDLDAALKRDPGLILVDEMAHTNIPDMRHNKRWQDIKELLDRGINVYTTLNVQHIESLNDDVAQIIHAPIKETVPDFMIELADTIEVVDIPPEDLIKRLKDGKVYIPQQAALAIDHFFQKGNLTALRELALRVTAERVGAQVLTYRKNLGIRYIWPTREKILVCVGPNPESLKLIRAAKRMANSLQADWIAVYVDTPKMQASESHRQSAIQHLRFAEQLGAQTHILIGFDIVKEIINFAHEQNVTQVMIWKHIRTRWLGFLFHDLADEIVRNSCEIDVYIMTGETSKTFPQEVKKRKTNIPWVTYGISTLIIGFVTIFNLLLSPFFPASNLIMIYLLGVIVIALFGKTGPSIYASFLSVFAYFFFFIPPYYQLVPLNFNNFLTLLVMLTVTQVISHLTIMVKRQTEAIRHVEKQTSALYNLSRQLAHTRGIDLLLDVGVRFLSQIFDSEVIALLPEGSNLIIRASSKLYVTLDEKEKSIAQWAYDMGQMAGLGTDTLPFSKALYVPLHGSKQIIGVLRILPAQPDTFTSPDQLRLLESCSSQIALALEVDRLSVKG